MKKQKSQLIDVTLIHEQTADENTKRMRTAKQHTSISYNACMHVMLKADIYVAYKNQGEHVDESDRLLKGVSVSPQSFDKDFLENFSRLSCDESIQSKRKGGFKTACTRNIDHQ